MKLTTSLIGAAVSALLLTPAANAHGTINPTLVASGATREFTIFVPNERMNEAIVAVAVTVPSGARLVEAASGGRWRARKHGETVTWRGGVIEPSRFDSFALRARMPAKTGTLTFRARESYSGGTAEQFALKVILVAPAEAASSNGAHTLAVAALAVAIGAAIIATAAFFLALRNWVRA